MTNAHSKCLPVSCHEYVHPWTESCWSSAAGQILHSLGNSSKIYTVVYTLSLLMRGRIPTTRDLQNTFLGIVQSTGFLVTNGCAYLIFACILRNVLGGYHFWTIAYTPAFIASFLAILVERPSRRPLLSLYVANLATETIWRMAVARNLVHPIQYGESLIFGCSTSILLYLYKRGLHKSIAKDSLFNVLKFVVSGDEEGQSDKSQCNSVDASVNIDTGDLNRIHPSRNRTNSNIENVDNANNNNDADDEDDDVPFADAISDSNDSDFEIDEYTDDDRSEQGEEEHNHPEQARQLPSGGKGLEQRQHKRRHLTNSMHKFKLISNAVKIYENFLTIIKTMPKHKSCQHSNSCIYYSVRGGIKLFSVGIGMQVALKLALQIKKILQWKLKFRKTIFNEGTLKLGLFLGGFSFLYKASSCSLRHLFGKDDPIFAFPAGLISSIAFTKYPDVTIALYVMWKMLQITYNMGIQTGYLPKVPGFTIFLYCASTATLFHAAALEAEALRPSYWKFLSSNSGGRVNHMDRRTIDMFGLNSYRQCENVQRLTNTANPKISFALS